LAAGLAFFGAVFFAEGFAFLFAASFLAGFFLLGLVAMDAWSVVALRAGLPRFAAGPRPDWRFQCDPLIWPISFTMSTTSA